MRGFGNAVIVALALGSLSDCAPTQHVTYLSDGPGATLAAATAAPPTSLNSLGLGPDKLLIFGGDSHKTYLGCLSCSQSDPDSVFNTYSTYGSKNSSESIFNASSDFGSKQSTESACNPYAFDPPVIVNSAGQYYGRLTVNPIRPVNPRLRAWLAVVCR